MSRKRKSPFAGLKAWLMQYAIFTMRERKGLLELLLFQVIGLGVLIYLMLTAPDEKNDFKKLNDSVVQYKQMQNVSSITVDTLSKESSNYPKEIKSSAYLFTFNPNNLPDSIWALLGLSNKQIRTIKNYELKGGKFYSKADVKKMYCISEEEYEKLEPFIQLPDVRPEFKDDSDNVIAKKKVEKEKVIEVKPVELNIASEEELITIPGIGAGRATAIIKYREKLGGYITIDQVKEAYGMDSVYDAVKKYFLLEIFTTRRMCINTNNASDLRHPYLTPAVAANIVNYRRVHGDYTSIDDLKKIALIDEKLFDKISPYLKLK